MAGTAQARFVAGSFGDEAPRPDARVAPRITSPANGTIVALDPDIPPARQRLQSAAQRTGRRWRLDRRELARGNTAAWLPWPGRHRVQIVNATGEVLDEIRVEVRGAGVRAAAAAR